MRTGLLLAGLAAVALGGCVSAHKLDQALAIPVGMNQVQVANKIGPPMVKDQAEDGSERWIWARKGQFGPESVTLVMKEGRVAAVESEGERLEHLKELERLRQMEEILKGKGTNVQLTTPSVRTNQPIIRTIPQRTTAVVPMPRGIEDPSTNAARSEIQIPAFAAGHEKSSAEIWREQEEALADAQREARKLEEHLRTLVEKARESERAAVARAEVERNPGVQTQEIPPLTAWYMARQFVGEDLRLAGKRRLFPNPRFTSAAGEERIGTNVWRTWGYVDTVDEKNAPKRLQWTAEMEYQGGTKWKLNGKVAFGEK
jgi:hypothetical protein